VAGRTVTAHPHGQTSRPVSGTRGASSLLSPHRANGMERGGPARAETWAEWTGPPPAHHPNRYPLRGRRCRRSAARGAAAGSGRARRGVRLTCAGEQLLVTGPAHRPKPPPALSVAAPGGGLRAVRLPAQGSALSVAAACGGLRAVRLRVRFGSSWRGLWVVPRCSTRCGSRAAAGPVRPPALVRSAKRQQSRAAKASSRIPLLGPIHLTSGMQRSIAVTA
jgi:hypothetical protein